MATRDTYREDLQDKLVGMEDEGYGDFEFTPAELNTYLELAVVRLFPAIYKRLSDDDLSITGYGNSKLGYISPTAPERVYMVEDATEMTPVTGWSTRPDKIVGLSYESGATFNAYYTDAYTMPSDDVTDVGLAEVYRPLVVLGSLIEALESRHDTGVRGEEPPTGPHFEMNVVDRLAARYDDLKRELAMSLPAMVA